MTAATATLRYPTGNGAALIWSNLPRVTVVPSIRICAVICSILGRQIKCAPGSAWLSPIGLRSTAISGVASSPAEAKDP